MTTLFRSLAAIAALTIITLNPNPAKAQAMDADYRRQIQAAAPGGACTRLKADAADDCSIRYMDDCGQAASKCGRCLAGVASLKCGGSGGGGVKILCPDGVTRKRRIEDCPTTTCPDGKTPIYVGQESTCPAQIPCSDGYTKVWPHELTTPGKCPVQVPCPDGVTKVWPHEVGAKCVALVMCWDGVLCLPAACGPEPLWHRLAAWWGRNASALAIVGWVLAIVFAILWRRKRKRLEVAGDPLKGTKTQGMSGPWTCTALVGDPPNQKQCGQTNAPGITECSKCSSARPAAGR